MAAGDIIFKGSTSLAEQRGSPSFVLAEKCTCTRILRGDYATCWSSKLYRGDSASVPIAPGSATTVTLLVDKCTMTCVGAGIGELRIEYAGSLDDTKIPDPEESVEHQQQQLRVEEHSRWSDLFTGSTGQLAMRAIDALLRCKTQTEMEAVDNYEWILDPNDVDYEPAYNQVYEMRRRGIHTFATFPPVISAVDFSISAPALDAGGYQDIPDVAAYDLPMGLAWIRCGDKARWNGTYYERTRTWLGAPSWDSLLYPDPNEPA
jgi:hypothetical protein